MSDNVPEIEVDDEEAALEGIRNAVRNRDPDRLQNAVNDALTCFRGESSDDYSAPSEGLMRLCAQLLDDQEFLGMKGSHHILYALRDNWDQIAEPKRTEFITLMERAFSRASDWMFPFLCAYILGRQCGDSVAVDVLSRLAKSSNEEARSTIPEALKYIVKHSQDVAVSTSAKELLLSMQDDDSEEVRAEAIAASADL